ncbi:ADP-ribosyl cyclase/cyclic ADP-ribose hydrolase 1-like isoform X2 [Corticium candelabrum]|uniref:ADP-ribosyl cyclase/cyclic ADP-ribose hydrolase 1-like isoform X2 n=1 Tax=Corticium candelabrum TaxID=121492 RepID=UPI002E263A03|nr:ADP-ribosyl cyclase/cyclic ADP-ribose hydrolase 1-like isoform X2 [Corticium candelabrum]
MFSDVNLQATTLRNTLTGYLVDELTWCGSVTDPSGFNWTECNPSNSNTNVCAGYNNGAFWSGASQRFALAARGSIGLLLNGSKSGNGKAYESTSFFGSVELPNLQPSQVTIVNIMLANDIGVTAKYGRRVLVVHSST